MTESLTPSPTEQVVTAIVDDPDVRTAVEDLIVEVRDAAHAHHVRWLIDSELLTQAITGAITRFVETAIDGQL